MTRASDTLADLRARRAEAAARADQLGDILDRYPNKEIKNERDRLCRLVDRYDETIASMSRT